VILLKNNTIPSDLKPNPLRRRSRETGLADSPSGVIRDDAAVTPEIRDFQPKLACHEFITGFQGFNPRAII
jgi:hypothetical protein